MSRSVKNACNVGASALMRHLRGGAGGDQRLVVIVRVQQTNTNKWPSDSRGQDKSIRSRAALLHLCRTDTRQAWFGLRIDGEDHGFWGGTTPIDAGFRHGVGAVGKSIEHWGTTIEFRYSKQTPQGHLRPHVGGRDGKDSDLAPR